MKEFEISRTNAQRPDRLENHVPHELVHHAHEQISQHHSEHPAPAFHKQASKETASSSAMYLARSEHHKIGDTPVKSAFIIIPSIHALLRDNTSIKIPFHRTQSIDKIIITYRSHSDLQKSHSEKPSFSVSENGGITMQANPDLHNNRTFTINVERPDGKLTKPGHAETKALTDLVKNLSEHFKHDSKRGFIQPLIDDQSGLISHGDAKHLAVIARPEEHLPARVRDAVDHVHLFAGAGSGHMDRHTVDSYFSKGHATGGAGTRIHKETIAGMANVASNDPYLEADAGDQKKIGVGRYQLNFELLKNWLASDNHHEKELENKPEFMKLLQELQMNEVPAADLIKRALPQALQERITTDLINQFEPELGNADGGDNGAKLALAFYLGHVPTASELSRQSNQSFLVAAQHLGALSTAKTLHPDQSLDFQTTTDDMDVSNFALKLAASVQQESSGSHAHGACSHYVRLAFDKVDPRLNKLFAEYAKDDHLADDSRFSQICSSRSQLAEINLRPGDTIVYGPKIGTNSAGHVETMGLDHLMHSDFSHKLSLAFASNYQWLKVYRPVG